MNKKSMVLLSSMLVTTGILTACGGEAGQEENNEDQNQAQEESQEENGENTSGDETANVDNMTAEEPGKNETCYYCEMGIPHPEDEQSVFTAQAITNEGERVFFDDSGCVENAEQEQDEEFAKVWVKDYNSDEWTEREGTTVVSDDSLETPMSYQYAFFEEEADADAYVEEHEAEVASWEDVQADAHERAQGGSMDHGEMDHGDMESSDDEDMNHDHDSESSEEGGMNHEHDSDSSEGEEMDHEEMDDHDDEQHNS